MMNHLTLAEKVTQLKNRFLSFPDWESRYKEMMELGKQLPVFPADQKLEKYLIKGCQSQVWLIPSFENGKLYFLADSDSLLVKGIIALLVCVYSGETPSMILSYKPDFLKEIGITEHLTMNRSNGLVAMVKQMQLYALAYQTLEQQK